MNIDGEIIDKVFGGIDPYNDGQAPGNSFYAAPFRPSSKMDDAMLVVDRMRELGLAPTLIDDDNGKWALVFGGFAPAGGGPGNYAYFVDDDWPWDESPAMAICLAALKVVEADDGQTA
jgi:hypothetical protein